LRGVVGQINAWSVKLAILSSSRLSRTTTHEPG